MSRPIRALSCAEVGAHRFNDDGDCIFCTAIEPPLTWDGDQA